MSWPAAERKDATALHAFNSKRSMRHKLFAYPRSCRLVRSADFDAVYRHGRRRSSPSFAIFYRPNELDISRFGMSVKRTLGGAVLRNRIRRRMREILRLNRQEIASGWDIVIHPRPSALTADYALLSAELLKLLQTLRA